VAAVGFVGQLGQDAEQSGKEQRSQDAEAKRALRERKADEIETAIKNLQSRSALQPNQPGYIAPDQLKTQLEAAQQQLSGLYQPHEGPDLLKRIKGIFDKKSAAPAQPSLHPGMTLSEVLAGAGPAPTAAESKADLTGQVDEFKKAWKEATGQEPSTEIMQDFISKKGGISGQEEKDKPLKQQYKDAGLSDEDADKAVRIHFGLQPKSVPAKPVKKSALDPNTDTVTKYNEDGTVSTWARSDPDQPEDVTKLFAGRKGVTAEKDKEQQTKFNQSLERQTHAFNLAIQRGDHAAAKRIVNTAKSDLLSAQERVETMDKNKKDALAGNQQAMLSLVANHIGMTLGAQKGARITRAVWDEAMESAPWLESQAAKWFHTDENGDHVFDGFKGGVTLTADQINQMVDLAHQKGGTLETHAKKVEETFQQDLGGKGGKDTTKPSAAPELTPEEKRIQDLLNK
jgi:hypothetical protein